MKKPIISSLVLIIALNALAQGTVVFNNRVASGTTHVWGGGTTQIRGNSPTGDNPPGTTSYAGLSLIGTTGLGGQFGAATTFAAMLGAPGTVPEGSPLLIQGSGGAVTTFRTGTAAGNIAATTATFNNIPKDAPVGTFQMVAWDNSSGLYSSWSLASVAWNQGLIAAGTSVICNVTMIGGDVNTPPHLTELTSFNIYLIPEPSAIVLVGLSTAALVIFRRRK